MSFNPYAPRPPGGRRPQDESKVPFKEVWPLTLRNKVSSKGRASREKPCLNETLSFLTCLKNNDHVHSACATEAKAMQVCYEQDLKHKREVKEQNRAAGDFIPGKSAAQMTQIQVNKYLKHFPHKLKIK